MSSSRPIRNKGKLSFSRYFQKFETGERVALVKEQGTMAHFSHRMQGRTGVVIAKRGSAYVIEVKDLGKIKQIITHPINLKRVLVSA